MLQVDVLHFSHFPTWQTLGLWLCLGLSSSGSWILILARGSLWQAHSLVRMWGASSALALPSTAEAAVLLLPGAGGQCSRPCPCSVSAPWPLCQFGGAGCTLSRDINQGTVFRTWEGNRQSTALMPPPGVLSTDLAPDTGAAMWENRPLWKDVECKIHLSWKHKYKGLHIHAQSRTPGMLESRKIMTLQCAVQVFALLTIGSKKMKCWFHSFHCVSLGLTGFQIRVTTGWVSLWWCQIAAQA